MGLEVEKKADELEKASLGKIETAIADREAGAQMVKENAEKIGQYLNIEVEGDKIQGEGFMDLEEGLSKTAQGADLLGKAKLDFQVAHGLEKEGNIAATESARLAHKAAKKKEKAAAKEAVATQLKGKAAESDATAIVKDKEAEFLTAEGEKFDLLASIIAKKTAIDEEFAADLQEVKSDYKKPFLEDALHHIEVQTDIKAEREKEADTSFAKASAEQKEAKKLKTKAKELREGAAELETCATHLKGKAAIEEQASAAKGEVSKQKLAEAGAKKTEATEKKTKGSALKAEGLQQKEDGLFAVELGEAFEGAATTLQSEALKKAQLGDVIEDADFSAKQAALKDLTAAHEAEGEALKIQTEALKVAKTAQEMHETAIKDKEAAYEEIVTQSTLEAEAIQGQKEALGEFMEADKTIHKGRDIQAAGEVKAEKSRKKREKAIEDLKESADKLKTGKAVEGKGAKYVGLAEEILKQQGGQ